MASGEQRFVHRPDIGPGARRGDLQGGYDRFRLMGWFVGREPSVEQHCALCMAYGIEPAIGLRA
jgi:hypothetical protein